MYTIKYLNKLQNAYGLFPYILRLGDEWGYHTDNWGYWDAQNTCFSDWWLREHYLPGYRPFPFKTCKNCGCPSSIGNWCYRYNCNEKPHHYIHLGPDRKEIKWWKK